MREFSDTVDGIVFVLWLMLLVLTFPLWILPYILYKRTKANKEKEK